MTMCILREDTIKSWRRVARAAYMTFHREGEGLDCGNAILKEVNPRAAKAAQQFNEAMAELRKLDPNCPAYTEL